MKNETPRTRRITTPKRDLSVRMETMLVITISGCRHRLTPEKARRLMLMLTKYLAGNAASADAKRVQKIKECVVEYYGLNADVFDSTVRDEAYTWPRHAAMLLSRELAPSLTFTQIGNEFRREHSTINYGIKAAQDRIDSDPKCKTEVETLRRKLSSNGHNILK